MGRLIRVLLISCTRTNIITRVVLRNVGWYDVLYDVVECQCVISNCGFYDAWHAGSGLAGASFQIALFPSSTSAPIYDKVKRRHKSYCDRPDQLCYQSLTACGIWCAYLINNVLSKVTNRTAGWRVGNMRSHVVKGTAQLEPARAPIGSALAFTFALIDFTIGV